MKIKTLKLLAVVSPFLLLTMCGKPVCVAGFGQCSAPAKPTSSSSALSVTTSASTLYYADSTNTPHTTTLTITGGTPPYSLSLLPSATVTTNIAYFQDPNNGNTKVTAISGVSGPTIVLYAGPTFAGASSKTYNLTVYIVDSLSSAQNSVPIFVSN